MTTTRFTSKRVRLIIGALVAALFVTGGAIAASQAIARAEAASVREARAERTRTQSAQEREDAEWMVERAREASAARAALHTQEIAELFADATSRAAAQDEVVAAVQGKADPAVLTASQEAVRAAVAGRSPHQTRVALDVMAEASAAVSQASAAYDAEQERLAQEAAAAQSKGGSKAGTQSAGKGSTGKQSASGSGAATTGGGKAPAGQPAPGSYDPYPAEGTEYTTSNKSCTPLASGSYQLRYTVRFSNGFTEALSMTNTAPSLSTLHVRNSSGVDKFFYNAWGSESFHTECGL